MEFTLDDLCFLRSPTGERLLERLRAEDLSDANALRLMTALRKEYGARESAAGVEMARLCMKAADKFGADAARMFFTRAALEQASDPLIRRSRATKSMDSHSVIDACCSIGTDTLAFASLYSQRPRGVLGLDIDPVRVEIARYNAAALGIAARFDVGDVTRDIRLHQLGDGDLIFFDPARRTDAGKRIHDVEGYQPPLSTLKAWLNPRSKRVRIEAKLSPGVDIAQVERYGGALTFYSVDGDLKEAGLSLYTEKRAFLCAAVLLTDENAYTWAVNERTDEVSVSEPRAYLCEPDPALIRAGYVQDIAARHHGTMLDETIAYFTCDALPSDPELRVWARAWRVLEWLPFNVKRLREVCRARGIGGVTVKKRGTAVTPEVIIPQLKLKGEARATLILTRCKGAQIAMLCDEMPVS
jgi:SAM-dependent methyltransferase